ncbi:endonuclease V isoform X2 [Sesamum indicum]|uniref:Endonuclease V isoform X2 n=1 Tax=Sesamum indicum TaxID=4182 RepID=A0A8M8UUV2_SESIN|nr:endonuclease V isoform X2 [Sesamum indicum]
MEEDASTSGNSNISPQLVNEWIEIQDSLKKRLITDDEFDWKLPPMKDQDSEGMEENQDSNVEILKYVGGVDLSFSRNDSLIACATLVVLDISTLEVVHEDSSIIKLRIPYVPGFLAFREAPVLLELLKKMETTSPTLYPQVLMVDGNGLLHPRAPFLWISLLCHYWSLLKSLERSAGFGLACHLGVLADLPTIGIGKNLHQVDGLTQSRVRQVLEANGKPRSDIFPLIGDSGSTLGALVIVYLFRVPSRLSSCLVGFGFQNPSGRLTLDQRIFFESMA